MGVSFSLVSWAGIEMMRNKMLGTKQVEAMLAKSISFGENEVKMAIRSLSFKRSDSGIKMSPKGSDNIAVTMERSLSFKHWEPTEEIKNIDDPVPTYKNQDPANDCIFKKTSMSPNRLTEFSSPRPRSELDAAAVKLQKVYKSYRTRRNLADCAVVVEELWWKALDFASLEHSSISFFDVEKPETAMSRWARARTRAAKVSTFTSQFTLDSFGTDFKLVATLCPPFFFDLGGKRAVQRRKGSEASTTALARSSKHTLLLCFSI